MKITKIILCTSCNGEGQLELSEIISYHNNDYRYWKEICSRCKGSGRLKETTINETTYVPYEEVINVNRELNSK